MKKGIAATNGTGKSKQAARQGLGRTGEHLAAEALMSTGYHILERNFRCRHGEIDLVAEDEHDLIFIEVKARRGTSYGRPAPFSLPGVPPIFREAMGAGAVLEGR